MGDIFIVLVLAAVAVLAFVFLVGLLRRLVSLVTISEYERGVKLTAGKYAGTLEPGMHWVSPIFSEIRIVDLRRRAETVEGQEVLTLDGVSLRLSLIAEYEIFDPRLWETAAQAPVRVLYLRLQSATRELIGGSPIDDLLARRGELGALLKERVEPTVAELGIRLVEVSLRDIMFPGALKRTMGLLVEARKEAEAALERARGETATLRSLANTARMLDKNPALLHLRTLKSLEQSSGNTLVLNLGGPHALNPTLLSAQGEA